MLTGRLPRMLVLALVFAALAALVHVYIFWIETVGFPNVGRRIFGLSAEQAAQMRPWAWNQGFYNLFLALGTAAGVALAGTDRHASVALVVAGTGSMLGAAVVLVADDRTRARAAIVQGTLPLICLLDLLVWSLTG